MKIKKQRGSITVEATLFLPLFFFAILSIYNLVYFSRAQLLMQTAADQAAKEVSQYSYILEKTGVLKAMDSLSGRAENFQKEMKSIQDNLRIVQEAGENAIQGEDVIRNSVEAGKAAKNTYNTVKKYIKNPSDFISGVLAACKNNVKDDISSYMVNQVAKSCLYQHFASACGREDSSEYMEMLGISNISLKKTQWCQNGSRDIKIVVDFDMSSNMPLFSLKPHHFRVCASTRVWSGV
ncbi:MAG: TadE family protein [Blautia sp.]|nr:TadE family protein [Blautia sp.]